MEFKFNSNIFKNSPEDLQRVYKDNYDPNKNYPNFTGTMTITKAQLAEFAAYAHWALKTDLKRDDYLDDVVIPVKVSGWAKESKSGKKFLSLNYAPDYKTMKAAQEAREAAQAEGAQAVPAADAATNLAQATNGTVVQIQQEDIF